MNRLERAFDLVYDGWRHNTALSRLTDPLFQSMGNITQGHGARHAGTSLECMQMPGKDTHCIRIVGRHPPSTKLSSDRLSQVHRFLKEDRQ